MTAALDVLAAELRTADRDHLVKVAGDKPVSANHALLVSAARAELHRRDHASEQCAYDLDDGWCHVHRRYCSMGG